MDAIGTLIQRWREDPGGTYRSWFLWEERLKIFRSIRRGLAEVVAEIESGRFGNVHKGSSFETVVRSIAEQHQIPGARITRSCGSPSCESPTSMRTRRTNSPGQHLRR